jgi:hypothetical protein
MSTHKGNHYDMNGFSKMWPKNQANAFIGISAKLLFGTQGVPTVVTCRSKMQLDAVLLALKQFAPSSSNAFESATFCHSECRTDVPPPPVAPSEPSQKEEPTPVADKEKYADIALKSHDLFNDTEPLEGLVFQSANAFKIIVSNKKNGIRVVTISPGISPEATPQTSYGLCKTRKEVRDMLWKLGYGRKVNLIKTTPSADKKEADDNDKIIAGLQRLLNEVKAERDILREAAERAVGFLRTPSDAPRGAANHAANYLQNALDTSRTEKAQAAEKGPQYGPDTMPPVD